MTRREFAFHDLDAAINAALAIGLITVNASASRGWVIDLTDEGRNVAERLNLRPISELKY